MSVLTILQAKRDTLTDGERQIADYVLADPERAIQDSSLALAEQVGRSQSGVIKFCQKIGFSGYQDFRLAVTRDSALARSAPADVVHDTIEVTDSYASTLRKLVGLKTFAMQRTISVNMDAAIGGAMDAILNARRVQLVGVGASSLVARDFGYKLQKLGYLTVFDADSHIQIANSSTLDTSDVVLALSYSGSSLETVSIAENARRCGAKLISVTGLQPNKLAQIADIQLFISADEQKARSSAITSRDAQLILTDLLFILLVQKMPNSGERILAAEQAAAHLKS